MRDLLTEGEDYPAEDPLGPARGITLAVMLSSGFWVGLAILVQTLW